MRIALLTSSAEGQGGVAHTLGLGRALVRLDPRVEVDVWTLGVAPDPATVPLDQPRVTICVVPFDGRRSEAWPDRVERARETMREEFRPVRSAYDVVHVLDGAGAEPGIPCIRTVHGLDDVPLAMSSAGSRTSVVVCPTRALAQKVRSAGGPEPVVIPDGVDAARFAAGVYDVPGQAAWRVRIGGRYVLAIDSVDARHGSIDLLEAHTALVEEQPTLGDVQLVFAGDHRLDVDLGYLAEFWERAAVLDAAPVILGPVAHGDLPALVAGASVVSHLPVDDRMPVAALEALAAGVPVLSRDLPALREVLGDSVAYATTVPSMTDALEDLLTDPLPPGTGAERAASYTWERAACAYLALYQDVGQKTA